MNFNLSNVILVHKYILCYHAYDDGMLSILNNKR